MKKNARIVAPWTAEEVALLNGYQSGLMFHAYTCNASDECAQTPLEATEAGWVCPKCGNTTQKWCLQSTLSIMRSLLREEKVRR